MRGKTGVVGKEVTKDQARQGIPWETGERLNCSKRKGARLKQVENRRGWNARKKRLSPYQVEKVGNFSKNFGSASPFNRKGKFLRLFIAIGRVSV